eukprot:1471285-Rhodomonas_salina.1
MDRGQDSTVTAEHFTLSPLTVNGQRSTVNGQRSTVNGQRSTLNAPPSTLHGQRRCISACGCRRSIVLRIVVGRECVPKSCARCLGPKGDGGTTPDSSSLERKSERARAREQREGRRKGGRERGRDARAHAHAHAHTHRHTQNTHRQTQTNVSAGSRREQAPEPT